MADTPTIQFNRRVAALSVIGLVAGCSTVEPRSASPAQGMRIPWQNLLPAYPVTRLWPWAEYVARNETEWEAIWQAAHRMDPSDEGVPRDGRPDVDFERYMVVGITRGLGKDSSYGLYFGQMIEWPHEIEVRFVHTNPDENTKSPMESSNEGAHMPAITFLARWALLPQSGKPVRFVRLRP